MAPMAGKDKGRILDELMSTTGWHREHAVRALRSGRARSGDEKVRRRRGGKYSAIRDTLRALWESSDRGPTLLEALERHGRLQLSKSEEDLVLSVSAATIDRLLGEVKVAAVGGRRRRAAFYSAIRREVPIRTFNDWKEPVPGFLRG